MSVTADSPLVSATGPAAPAVVPQYATGTYSRYTGPLPDLLATPWVKEDRRYRLIWLGMALLVLAVYSAFVLRYWAAADEGVDQNAYLVGGRLLAEHGTMRYVLPNPFAYTGGMWVRMADGTYFPKYPIGLPLLYAFFFWGLKIAAVIPGLKGHVNAAQAGYWAFTVSPLSSIAAVWGTFLLARRLAGSFPAVMAAILLGTSQLMISLSNNPNSHAACTASAVWGFYALVCWQQTGGWWKGAIGGFLIGFAATIRYSEFLFVIPVALACLAQMRWGSWKTYVGSGLVASLVLGAFFLFENFTAAATVPAASFTDRWWHNAGAKTHTIAGAVLLMTAVALAAIAFIQFTADHWKSLLRNIVPGLAWAVPVGAMIVFNLVTMHTATGYDTTHESASGSAFTWKFFVHNWEMVIRALYDMGAFFVLPIGIVGMIMLFRRSWQVGLTLVGWFLPGVLLYMAYYWSMDFDVAYTRFFLTFIPAVAIGAAVCFKDGILGGDNGPRRWASIPLVLAVFAVVMISAGVNVFRSVKGLRDGDENVITINDLHADRSNDARAGQVLLKYVPAGSVLFADDSGLIANSANYMQFLNDWDVYGADAFTADAEKKIHMAGGKKGSGDTNDLAKANPFQQEQVDYLVGLYHNPKGDLPGRPKGTIQWTPEELRAKETALIDDSFKNGKRVFVCVSVPRVKDYMEEDGRTKWMTHKKSAADLPDPMHYFAESLKPGRQYTIKSVSHWEDVTMPPDKPDPDDNDNHWNGFGHGGGGLRWFMKIGQDRIWELAEIVPGPDHGKPVPENK